MAQKSRLAIIVGLGNPGEAYRRTRHNAGHWFVDELAAHYAASFRAETRFKAEICRVDIDGNAVWLMKPTTYMNECGLSVSGCVAYYKLDVTQLLVAHDELSLPCGKVQIKRGGGHGGHNGLRDISSHAGSDFVRLRIGIDHPGKGADVARYVLNTPPVEQIHAIESAVTNVVDNIETIVRGDFGAATKAIEKVAG